MIEQTKIKPQGTLEFKMNKQMQTFPFNAPINLLDEGKWLLTLSYFECKNSVFNITEENNSFSINIPGHWGTEFDRKTFAKIDELMEPRSLELHVEEVRKRGQKIKIGDSEYKLSDFDTQKKNEKLEELKKVKNNDLEDLVYKMQLTFFEFRDILDLKYIPKKRTGYSLNPGIYEVVDLKQTFKYSLPDNVKISVTIDDVRIKSILKTNHTFIFNNKSFFILY